MTDTTREKIAQKLYEKTKAFADLMYDISRRFNLPSDPRYDLWTTKWGDWDSLDETFKKLYRLEAEHYLALIPDTKSVKTRDKEIAGRLEKLLKYNPVKSMGLRCELGKFVEVLKRGID